MFLPACILFSCISILLQHSSMKFMQFNTLWPQKSGLLFTPLWCKQKMVPIWLSMPHHLLDSVSIFTNNVSCMHGSLICLGHFFHQILSVCHYFLKRPHSLKKKKKRRQHIDFSSSSDRLGISVFHQMILTYQLTCLIRHIWCVSLSPLKPYIPTFFHQTNLSVFLLH